MYTQCEIKERKRRRTTMEAKLRHLEARKEFKGFCRPSAGFHMGVLADPQIASSQTVPILTSTLSKSIPEEEASRSLESEIIGLFGYFVLVGITSSLVCGRLYHSK